jgi:fucose permease
MLKKAMYAALLVGATFGSCFPNCCDLKLPNLGKCFSAQPCELLFALLGGIAA